MSHDLRRWGGRLLAVEIVVAVAVLIGVAFVVARPDIGGIEDEDTDRADIGLPQDRLLRSADINNLRFRAISGWRGGVRGYRFSDVDATMAKVEEALRAAEDRRSPPPSDHRPSRA